MREIIKDLKEGQSHEVTCNWGSSEGNREVFVILSSVDYEKNRLSKPIELTSYRPCLKCNHDLLLINRTETSDGMCGVYYLGYLCSNSECRLMKRQKIETYGWLEF